MQRQLGLGPRPGDTGCFPGSAQQEGSLGGRWAADGSLTLCNILLISLGVFLAILVGFSYKSLIF